MGEPHHHTHTKKNWETQKKDQSKGTLVGMAAATTTTTNDHCRLPHDTMESSSSTIAANSSTPTTTTTTITTREDRNAIRQQRRRQQQTPHGTSEKKKVGWDRMHSCPTQQQSTHTHTHIIAKTFIPRAPYSKHHLSLTHTILFLYCLWGAENFIQRECNIYENFATVSSKRH